MRCGFLNVGGEHSVERGGNERVPQRGGVTVSAIRRGGRCLRTIRPAPRRSSRRPSAASRPAAGPLADGQVDRPGRARRERDGDHLAALAGDGQRPVPVFQAQVLDVGAGGLGDA